MVQYEVCAPAAAEETGADARSVEAGGPQPEPQRRSARPRPFEHVERSRAVSGRGEGLRDQRALVQPPIHARAILMITPSFETYTTQSSQGINHYNYQLGQSAAGALQYLVAGSFDHGRLSV